MKLTTKTLDRFESNFEAAAYVCILYAAKRMLDFEGERIAHTFLYNRESDLPRVKETDGIAKMKSVYSRVNLSMLCEYPEFDPKKSFLVIITCDDSKRKQAVVFPIEIVRYAESCTPCEVAICPSKSENGRGCAACGIEPAMKRCAGCKTLKYCSERCQRDNWSVHKESCKKIQKAMKAHANS